MRCRKCSRSQAACGRRAVGDFARLETDTKASEAEAQADFDKFSNDSASNKAANQQDVDHKTTKRSNQKSALTRKKEDLANTQEELDAALQYYDKLKPSYRAWHSVELEGRAELKSESQDIFGHECVVRNHTFAVFQRILRSVFL